MIGNSFAINKVLIMTKGNHGKKKTKKERVQRVVLLSSYDLFMKGSYGSQYDQEVIMSYAQKSNVPHYNNDGKYYTPSFHVENKEKDDEYYWDKHTNKVKEVMAEHSEIMIAHPRRKRSYCSVCCKDYDSYIEHIQSKKHKTKSRQNKYQQLIQIEAQKYNRQLKLLRKQNSKESQTSVSRETGDYIKEAQGQNFTELRPQKKKPEKVQESNPKASRQTIALSMLEIIKQNWAQDHPKEVRKPTIMI